MAVVIECEALLRSAAQWRLLSLLLEPPEGTWREQVEALAPECGDADLEHAARLAIEEASQGLYHSTFGPGGPASPRAISYEQAIQPGQRLAEISAQFQAFAYTPALAEPPDHVAIEAGFVSYLRFKEAYAQMQGDTECAEIAAEASRQFAAAHLAPLAQSLAERLRAGSVPYLIQAAALMADRIRREITTPVNDSPGGSSRSKAGLHYAVEPGA